MYLTSNEILNMFEVGDVLIITKLDGSWSSELNKNCPHDINNYPYKLTIEKIKLNCDNKKNMFVSVSDGKYGWCLSSLVRNNCIDMEKFKRYKKLKKLNK